ncbi:hypothetical protein LRS13_09965 [Svornostia abyssi]|uniref:Uncharacterized protein n=1 Tax=Svornostia abyssi TaxID=2898438 RepID=A0ABY5PM92_9ACTN|nr:hypothetical protein LRS13_09965 [Parviterribacteraceae bacterium J379]
MSRLALSLLVVVAALLAATPAFAKDGDDDREDRPEVRVAGSCASGVTSKLKLKARDGELEVEFEVDSNRSGERWRVTLVRERRVFWRGTERTEGRSGSFSVERRLDDLDGPDTVTARAVGPRSRTCRATATLPG